METMLITGGNSGIGYYMTEAWLQKGNRAIVIDILSDNLKVLMDKYEAQLDILECDITDFPHLKKLIEEVSGNVGTIDIAVHNACRCIFKSVMDCTIDEYRQVMDVNLIGAINLTKVLLPIMKLQAHGKLCYTSSGVGVTGYTHISGYSASKGAIESFAKSMKIEHSKENITFHIIHPPLTDTNSSSPLPIPKEVKANPKTVGYGIVKNLHKNKFVITPSLLDCLSVKLSYLFPLSMGKLLNFMTERAKG